MKNQMNVFSMLSFETILFYYLKIICYVFLNIKIDITFENGSNKTL